jgi:hypothetical protein
VTRERHAPKGVKTILPRGIALGRGLDTRIQSINPQALNGRHNQGPLWAGELSPLPRRELARP